MDKNLMLKAILVIVATIFAGVGCLQVPSEKEDLLAVEPNVAAIVVPGDYAASALAATGGVVAWTKVIQLGLDGVVTFYQPDGSFYLTEQHFEVYPWSNSIRISAQEPQGKYCWQLTGGKFTSLDEKGTIDTSTTALSSRDYAETVLDILVAPVCFLDKSVGFIKSPTPVRKEGLWYYQIEMTYPTEPVASADVQQQIGQPIQPNFPKVIFFQNTNNSLIEMIWLADPQRQDEGPGSAGTQDRFLMVRGYDYQKVSEDGVLVPSKIEVFRSDNRAFIKERLVKIDFKNLWPE
jgi:hypothetical protein